MPAGRGLILRFFFAAGCWVGEDMDGFWFVRLFICLFFVFFVFAICFFFFFSSFSLFAKAVVNSEESYPPWTGTVETKHGAKNQQFLVDATV